MTIEEMLEEVAKAVSIEKKPITAPEVLNEAFTTSAPVLFRVGCGSISGTSAFC